MNQSPTLQAAIPESMSGKRLDYALARLFPEYSRSKLQQWLHDGHIIINNQIKLPGKTKVAGGEQITLHLVLKKQTESLAEKIPLDIIFEDDEIIVINKPAGLVMHPAAGNQTGTLLNALLHHEPGLANIPRAGIVHRLDKDTTGLLVIAKTISSQKYLVEQLQARTIKREYQAIVHGNIIAGSTIDTAIGRHPVDRKRMAVNHNGKHAVTHYRIAEKFRLHTHIDVKLETGRTHQIRVHMAYLKHPLVGDPVYGGRLRIPPHATVTLENTLRNFKRQALHAIRLTLHHPKNNKSMTWHAPLPHDMVNLLNELREDSKNHV